MHNIVTEVPYGVEWKIGTMNTFYCLLKMGEDVTKLTTTVFTFIFIANMRLIC